MLSKEDYNEVHHLVEEYYIEHSKLINRLLDKLTNPSDTQGEFLMLANERNSVYSREEDIK